MKAVVDFLSSRRGAVVLFSGGNDSLALCLLAKEAYKRSYLCLTIVYPYTPEWTVKRAKELAKKFRLKHQVVEMDLPYELRENQPLRCYWCKKYMFLKAKELAKKGWVVVEGSTKEESERLGLRAAWEEGVVSPFIEVGVGRKEVLAFLKEKGVEPAPSETCMLTRLPFRFRVDVEKLKKLEKIEEALREVAEGPVRARLHDQLIRIEVEESELSKVLQRRKELLRLAKKLGFSFLTLDLKGYQEGSMCSSRIK